MANALDAFRARHRGASVAVLGSSPTIGLYRGQEDVTIGVNGSAIALRDGHRMDYFMCGDRESPARRWFLASERFGAIRFVSSHVLPFDPLVIPGAKERQKLQGQLKAFVGAGNRDWRFRLKSYPIRTKHSFFEYKHPWEQRVSHRQRMFAKGGTISGMAVQMALVMGASSIHLYGCSFEPVDGVHYGYDSAGELGQIKFWQPIGMDFILSQVLRLGVRVFAHGPTSLRMVERVE